MCVCVCVCVCVALFIQHAIRMRHDVVYGLPRSTILSHISTIFENTLLDTKCVLISSTKFIWYISHSKKKWAVYYQMYIGIQ